MNKKVTLEDISKVNCLTNKEYLRYKRLSFWKLVQAKRSSQIPACPEEAVERAFNQEWVNILGKPNYNALRMKDHISNFWVFIRGV